MLNDELGLYWAIAVAMLMKNVRKSNSLTIFLKVQLCQLYSNKYMIASTQITNAEIFAFIAVLVFQLLSRKILFINRKDKRNC